MKGPSEHTSARADILTKGTEDEKICALTEQLRLIRIISQQRRYPGRDVPRLPSRRKIIAILEDIRALLYPRHFGPADLTPEATDTWVAAMLADVKTRLAEQILTERMLSETAEAPHCAQAADREAMHVLTRLVIVRDIHDTDIVAAWAGDPSAKSLDEVHFCFPGVAAILTHRIAHELYLIGATMIARIMAEHSHSLTGIDIHPGAKIGPAFFVDHGTGVVIGETAVIGRNVRLYQQVTLGARSFRDDGTGTLIKGEPRHPVIEDNVVIYAGATILGRITIGRGSVIGGGVWLTEPLPPETRVTQALPELSLYTPKSKNA